MPRPGGRGSSADRGTDPPPLAEDTHPAARRFRLRPRDAHGMVRGQSRRLPVRPGSQPTAGGGDPGRTDAGQPGQPADRQPGAPLQGFHVATLDSWSRNRRVVGKAEVTRGEANPRFVVTSLTSRELGAQRLYEVVYCARGEMENRIKECQLDLFADRTSAATNAPTSSACGSPPWPMCCSAACDASGCRILNSPKQPVEPSGSGC